MRLLHGIYFIKMVAKQHLYYSDFIKIISKQYLHGTYFIKIIANNILWVLFYKNHSKTIFTRY